MRAKGKASEFAEWVRSTRRAKDLTLEAVAQRAGVKFPIWSRWERGNQTPRRETVIKIAQALGENVDLALVIAGYLPISNQDGHTLTHLEPLMQKIPAERRSKAIQALRMVAESFLMLDS